METPRLLYVVTEDWYFLSHRLPMARAARDAGFEVHVATNIAEGEAAIRAEGFIAHHVPFARGRLSPLAAVRTIAALRSVHDRVRPTIAHHVSLQSTVFASLAALDRDVASVNAVTGLGFAFTSETAKARVIRPILGTLLRRLLDRGDTVALVQNPDDRAALRALGIAPGRIHMIAGSGVDLTRFSPTAEPSSEPITVGFASRLLRDKGIHTLVAAHRLLRARGRDIRLVIAGAPDPANPSSIETSELDLWRREPGIELRGHVDDVAQFWPRVHIAVLPSRREGLPKALIEAAACGRPMIACDVPGCREVVIDQQTGLLVPVDDPRALAERIDQLASSADLRARLGAAARGLAEQRFSNEQIARAIIELYSSLRERRGRRAA